MSNTRTRQFLVQLCCSRGCRLRRLLKSFVAEGAKLHVSNGVLHLSGLELLQSAVPASWPIELERATVGAASIELPRLHRLSTRIKITLGGVYVIARVRMPHTHEDGLICQWAREKLAA